MVPWTANYYSSLGSLAPEVPDYSAILLPIFSKRVLHIMSPAHRHHDKSMGCEPDEAWLSLPGSWGAEGRTTLIDFSARSLNVSVYVTTSDLGHRNQMQKERAF